MKTNWRERFDERFPLPEHERISKCSCTSEAEHMAHYVWAADREEVEAFIETLLEEVINSCVSEATPEEIDNKVMRDAYNNAVHEQKHHLRAKWLTKDASLAGERREDGELKS